MNCKKCDDGQMTEKTGPHGKFLGCSNYPECRNTEQIVSKDFQMLKPKAETVNTVPTPETHVEDNPKVRTTRTFAEVSAGEIIKEAVKILTSDCPEGSGSFKEVVTMVNNEFKRVRDDLNG